MSIFSDIQRDKIPQYRSCGIEIIKTRARIFFHNKQRLVLSASITNTHRKGRYNMKATGIVRRIDDLGRVVIPKEIRRTMRIREGDPLEIYTTRDGEVIFKKYSLIGGLEDFAAQFCDTLSRNTDFTAAVTDRDGIVAVAGAGKRELLGKNLSPQLEQIMEQRSIYQYRSGQERLPVSESAGQYAAAVAAPILCGGDVLGLVLFVSAEDRLPGEGEYKLAQAVAGFLGKHMET